MNWNIQKEISKLVEVTALLALSLHGVKNASVIERLEGIAFPNKLAERINNDDL